MSVEHVENKQVAPIGHRRLWHTQSLLNAFHVTDVFNPQSRLDDQEQKLKCSHIWELDLSQVKIYSISQG